MPSEQRSPGPRRHEKTCLVRTQSRGTSRRETQARLGVNRRRVEVCKSLLNPALHREGPGRRGPGLKPDSGKPTVRDFRGDPGNVTMEELGTHSPYRKGRCWKLFSYRARAWVLPD